MERKEQTGHICRWMALGIMTAIVIVGCTIVIGLFEWRDRKEIECRNAELHQWRKNVHDLNLHITELSPDFVIVSPKKYKSSNISRQECKKSGLFSYRGSSLLFYPSFCASPNAIRIILDYQAFTSMS